MHPLSSDSEFAISLLVGADYYSDIVGDKVVHGSGPTAVESKLGYLLSGSTQQGHPYSMTTNVSMTQSDFDLERFWSLELIGVSQGDDTVEVNMTENYLTSCATQATDGAYVAWRTLYPPCKYTVAEHRTQQLAKRLVIQPKLLQL